MKALQEIREFFETGLAGIGAIPEDKRPGKVGEAVDLLHRMLAHVDELEAVLGGIMKTAGEVKETVVEAKEAISK
jgi:hypothetical protein